MTDPPERPILSVADVKRRFSDVIGRVERGERIVVSRRGKPVLALVPADSAGASRPAPVGLAAMAGTLGDWHALPRVVTEIYAARRRARDRAAPDLG